MIKLVALLCAVALVAAACSDGSPVSEGAASSADVNVNADDQTSSDSVGSDQDSNASGDEDGAGQIDGDSGDPTDNEGGESPSSVGPLFAGACSVDQVFRQKFYAVSGIPEDDPDGGLNVRDNYEDGERLATLPEGSIVLVEDCFAREDGGVWWSVESAPDVFGWVNSAFLSPDISALEPTIGGQETGRKVEALLDAFNAEAWDEAADLLTADSLSIFLPQLGVDAGQDLVADLESYCAIRICDAPFEIVELRGSYVPDRIYPEVDVRFDYPQGPAVETFRGVYIDGQLSSLDSLPGRSFLALPQAPPSASDLVASPADVPDGALQAAEEIRLSLLSGNGPAVPLDYIPGEGVAISTNAYVDPEPGRRVYVTEEDLTQNGNQVRIWGYSDGIGTPIVESIDDWFATYKTSIALQEPDDVGADGTRIGFGNTIANLGEQFPNATVVEFHRRGRGDLESFNWSSLRMALEQREGDWHLLAITTDTWTI